MTSATPQGTTTSGDPDLEPGTTVGEYTIESLLGKGGFGKVFKATHPLIGKVAAIKVLAPKFSADPEMVERFVAEARAVNQIRHRHIIDIFSFGTLEDGRAYYAMEYLEGETLDALLERRGKLPLAEALPILRAVGRALDAAHAKGIAHRDLKPENIFIATDDDGGTWPKLLDFGIAKLLGNDDGKSKTRTGIPMGTPYYMSPEQCRGKNVDHRTDYYAFGVVAYQMLAGTYPIDGDDFMSIMMRQMNDMPEPPSTHAPLLPPGVDEVVIQLMEKDPADRPSKLAEAIARLEEAAANAGVRVPSARISTPVATQTAPAFAATMAPAQTLPPIAKKSKLPLAIGAVVIAGAIAAFALTRGGGDDKKPAPPPPPPVAIAPVVAPPPAIDAPAPIKRVMITIAGAPEGTEIFRDGTELGAAPGPIQLDQGSDPVVLTFKADGYVVVSRPVTPTADQKLDVVMKPKARPVQVQRPHTSKDDIFDNVDFDKKK